MKYITTKQSLIDSMIEKYRIKFDFDLAAELAKRNNVPIVHQDSDIYKYYGNLENWQKAQAEVFKWRDKQIINEITNELFALKKIGLYTEYKLYPDLDTDEFENIAEYIYNSIREINSYD